MTKPRFNVGDIIEHRQPCDGIEDWVIKGKIMEILDNDVVNNNVVIIEVENENYTRILITNDQFSRIIEKTKETK